MIDKRNYLLIALILFCFVLNSCGTRAVADLTVASYNLRYANSSDSLKGNGWGYRYPIIAQIIKYHGFEVVGTQEAYKSALEDLKTALSTYEYIGVGRDDGESEGEHSAIFYLKDRFEVLDSGDFWLSETPDIPSVGWDAALPRICTWGHFRNKDDGSQFLFFNLHMDHVGVKARSESALLVKKKIKELDKKVPIILTGDFNVDQRNPSYEEIINDGTLFDSYTICDLRYAPNGTSNGFNINSFTTSRIDHVFVSDDIHVKSYGVLTDTYHTAEIDDLDFDLKDFPKEISAKLNKARVPSDHYPVKVVLQFK